MYDNRHTRYDQYPDPYGNESGLGKQFREILTTLKRELNRMHRQRLMVLVAAVVGFAGSFMTWISFGGAGIGGWNYYGKFTAICFAVVIFFTLNGNRMRRISSAWKVIAPALISLFFGSFPIFAGMNKVNILFFSSEGSFGFGLYLVILAGIAVPTIIQTNAHRYFYD